MFAIQHILQHSVHTEMWYLCLWDITSYLCLWESRFTMPNITKLFYRGMSCLWFVRLYMNHRYENIWCTISNTASTSISLVVWLLWLLPQYHPKNARWCISRYDAEEYIVFSQQHTSVWYKIWSLLSRVQNISKFTVVTAVCICAGKHEPWFVVAWECTELWFATA